MLLSRLLAWALDMLLRRVLVWQRGVQGQTGCGGGRSIKSACIAAALRGAAPSALPTKFHPAACPIPVGLAMANNLVQGGLPHIHTPLQMPPLVPAATPPTPTPSLQTAALSSKLLPRHAVGVQQSV